MTTAEPPVYLVPFARSVLSLLSTWTALQISFEQSSAYQSSAQQHAARSELATELVGAFLDARDSDQVENDELAIPDQEELEDFLLGWVFGTLDVRVEDESEISISRNLIGLWREWSRMVTVNDEESVRQDGELIMRIERLAEGRRSHGTRLNLRVIDEGKISDEEESGDEDRMEIESIQPRQNDTRGRASPIIDDEGFTLVTKSNQHR